MIPGVGPDAPPTVNEKGGKQSYSPYRFDLLDAKAMLRLAEIAGRGAAKYGADNWRKLDINDNINHALVHLYAHLAGDKQDDHLVHALCRVLFATAQDGEEDEATDDEPKPYRVVLCGKITGVSGDTSSDLVLR
ncbi:MAG: dATP/dGTP diphosphohydrolase domain-containing protein [Clostridia bacterium]|nr:dATP/dGTP diphosphohydrolase domain-containing protein [Clostridia bacterium]